MNIILAKKINSLSIISVLILSVHTQVLANNDMEKEKLSCRSKNAKIVERLLDEVWSKGKLDVVDELVSPEYTIRRDPGDPWEGKTLDLANFKKRLEGSRKIFPNQQFYIEDILCDGNKVAVSWHFTGTQQGDIPGLPTTNKNVDVSGMTIYYLSNGKVTGHWQVFDKLGLVQQLKSP